MNTQYLYYRIKVSPKSKEAKLKEILSDGTLKISLKSAPKNNKANIELIQFLSQHFAVDKSQIKIISGHTSTTKLIKIIYEP